MEQKKETIEILKDLWRYEHSEYPEKDIRKALDIAIKALQQELVLDKIREEIEQAYCKVEDDYDKGRNYGLHIAKQIIDNYKLESEG